MTVSPTVHPQRQLATRTTCYTTQSPTRPSPTAVRTRTLRTRLSHRLPFAAVLPAACASVLAALLLQLPLLSCCPSVSRVCVRVASLPVPRLRASLFNR